MMKQFLLIFLSMQGQVLEATRNVGHIEGYRQRKADCAFVIYTMA